MPTTHTATIDNSLLHRLTNLINCSRCLRHGRTTPVRQIISSRHRPRTLCQACRKQAE